MTILKLIATGIFALLAACFMASCAKPALALAVPAPARLKNLLERGGEGDMPILLPCCYDGLTARLVARAGFEATFMTGFGVSGNMWNHRCSMSPCAINSQNDIFIFLYRCKRIPRHPTCLVWRNASCSFLGI